MRTVSIYNIFIAGLLTLCSACEINNHEDVEILTRKIKESNYYHDPGMNCYNPASIQPPYQCLADQYGYLNLSDYSNKYNAHGSWTNNANLCLTLEPNGTGTYRSKAANGAIRFFSIKWGIWVDQTGAPILIGNNSGYLYLEGNQIEAGNNYLEFDFNTNKIISWGLVKGTCNF